MPSSTAPYLILVSQRLFLYVTRNDLNHLAKQVVIFWAKDSIFMIRRSNSAQNCEQNWKFKEIFCWSATDNDLCPNDFLVALACYFILTKILNLTIPQKIPPEECKWILNLPAIARSLILFTQSQISIHDNTTIINISPIWAFWWIIRRYTSALYAVLLFTKSQVDCLPRQRGSLHTWFKQYQHSWHLLRSLLLFLIQQITGVWSHKPRVEVMLNTEVFSSCVKSNNTCGGL